MTGKKKKKKEPDSLLTTNHFIFKSKGKNEIEYKQGRQKLQNTKLLLSMDDCTQTQPIISLGYSFCSLFLDSLLSCRSFVPHLIVAFFDLSSHCAGCFRYTVLNLQQKIRSDSRDPRTGRRDETREACLMRRLQAVVTYLRDTFGYR